MERVRVSAFLAFTALIVAVATGCTPSAPESSAPAASGHAPTDNPPPVGNAQDFEIATAVAACLADRGWDVEVTDAGGWGVEAAYPSAQADVYRTDYATCNEESGYADVAMTEELAGFWYANTERVVACLEDLDYDTPDGPTREAFIRMLMEDRDAIVWDPYALVPPGEFNEAALACPQ